MSVAFWTAGQLNVAGPVERGEGTEREREREGRGERERERENHDINKLMRLISYLWKTVLH